MQMQGSELQRQLDALATAGAERISRLVDVILADACRRSASDVHFEPTHAALEIRYRLDGVLHRVAALSRELAPNLAARLKVLAELLTYRLDIPQEGRLAEAAERYGVPMRVSTFPLVHGEKVVVRLFETGSTVLDLDQLGLPESLLGILKAMLRERQGALLLTGPSGSGKTTTIYACLRHLIRDSGGGQQIVTIEDPVEQVLEGVSQAQARPGTEFDFARGLRSLLRQDPEVIMIGEVRDAETAAIALSAALTGHLVITTLHAGSACGVVGRLLDMGIEPYLLTSGLKGILNQRLVRRLCPVCRGTEHVAHGCSACRGTGYQGRLLLAELLILGPALRQAILARSDTAALEAAAASRGRASIWTAAEQAIADGSTTRQEIERVLGPCPNGPSCFEPQRGGDRRAQGTALGGEPTTEPQSPNGAK
jgi:type II secretory ATPase GspE/PulE/Tfp pilus assembly ATPase PilB-like protein